MSQHGLGLKKEGKKQNIDPVFNSSAVLFYTASPFLDKLGRGRKSFSPFLSN
jgi:hypothetical protein